MHAASTFEILTGHLRAGSCLFYVLAVIKNNCKEEM